jgi:hypothetical protein
MRTSSQQAVTAEVPTFDELRELMVSRKPPLTARVLQRRVEEPDRSATVIYDGLNGWYIDDGVRIELRPAEDRAVLVEDGVVERYGPRMDVYVHGWVKLALDPRRMAELEEATGSVVGREVLLERDCWIAMVMGLRADEEAEFTLHVDVESGVVVRIAREDLPGEVLEVRELRLGTVHVPER